MSKVDKKLLNLVSNFYTTAKIVCSHCGLQQEVSVVDDQLDAAMFFADCGWTISKKTEDPVCKHCSKKNKK